MSPEVTPNNKPEVITKIDWDSFLVPVTEKRSRALGLHRPVINEIYNDTKHLIEISGDTETTRLFRILGDIANLTLQHSNQVELTTIDPAETSLRYLRACYPKRFEKVRNLQKSRKGRDINSILMDLGPDPGWISAKRIIKSS